MNAETVRGMVRKVIGQETEEHRVEKVGKEQITAGQHAVVEFEINKKICLSGTDLDLLCLMVSLRRLNIQIEDSKVDRTISAREWTDEKFDVKLFTPKTLRFIQTAERLKDYTDQFIANHYIDSLNRARTIQIAVSNLYTFRGEVARYDPGPGTIGEWGHKWKRKLSPPTPTPSP